MNHSGHLWDRFETMLEAKAPALFGSMLPPVSEKVIEAAETVMEIQLPDDVRDAYLRHNGTISGEVSRRGDGSLFVPFNWWVSLQKMVEHYLHLKSFHAVNRATNPETYPVPEASWANLKVQPTWGNDKWIPIGLSGTPTIVFVDLDPAPKGCVGQLMIESGTFEPELVAPSFNAYLEMLIERVSRGALIFRDGWIWTETDEHVYDWNRIG